MKMVTFDLKSFCFNKMIFVFLICFLCGCAFQTLQKARETLRWSSAEHTACQKAEAGDIVGGRMIMDELVQTDPSIQAHHVRGLFISVYQNPEEALEDWTCVIDNLEGKAMDVEQMVILKGAYTNRSKIYVKQGLKLKALADEEKALALLEELSIKYSKEKPFTERGAIPEKIQNALDTRQFISRANKMALQLEAGDRQGAINEFMNMLRYEIAFRTPKSICESSGIKYKSSKEMTEDELKKEMAISASYGGVLHSDFMRNRIEQVPKPQGLDFEEEPMIVFYALLLGDDAVDPVLDRLSDRTIDDVRMTSGMRILASLYPAATDHNKQRIVEALLVGLDDSYVSYQTAPSWSTGSRIYFEIQRLPFYLDTSEKQVSIGGQFVLVQFIGTKGFLWHKENGELAGYNDANTPSLKDFEACFREEFPVQPIRATAIEALGEILENSNNKMIWVRIKDATFNSHTDARRASVTALAKISKDKETIAFIEKAIDDSSWIVREQAALELVRLKARQCVDTIKRRLELEKFPPVKKALAEAIEALR